MSTDSFAELCRSVCAHLKIQCPNLQPPEAAVPGLELRFGGVGVSLLQASVDATDWGLLLV